MNETVALPILPRGAGARASGFTLIEVLIALVILGVGVLGVIAVFPAAFRNASEASEEALASLICRDVQAQLEVALREPNPNRGTAGQEDTVMFRAPETTIPRCYFRLPPHPFNAAAPQNYIWQFPEGSTLGAAGAVPGTKDPAIGAREVWEFLDRWAPASPLGNVLFAGANHWTVPTDFEGDEPNFQHYSFDVVVYPKPSVASAAPVAAGIYGPYQFEVRVWRDYDPAVPKFDDPSLPVFQEHVNDRQMPLKKFTFILHSVR